MPDTFYSRSNNLNRYIYTEDISCITSNGEYIYKTQSPSIIYDDNFPDETIIDGIIYKNLISKNKKLVIFFHNSYYHFIVDMVPLIYDLIQKNKKIEIIIYFEYDDKSPSYLQYVLKKFEEKNIKYQLIFKSQYKNILINNFYIYNHTFYMLNNNEINNIEKFFDINSNSDNAYKKIYLSRNKTNIKSRINNEIDLENFLKNNGFEIVYPEDFIDFNSQLNFLKNVKILISCTSSGLTNQIFMPRNGTVIEFVTLMRDIKDNEETAAFHHFYSVIAFLKNHSYLGIFNYYNDANAIIEQINNNNILKKVILNE